MQEPETEGRRPRIQVVSPEREGGNNEERLKMRKKNNKKRPFPKMDRQMDPRKGR
jgi:hypothetical protein